MNEFYTVHHAYKRKLILYILYIKCIAYKWKLISYKRYIQIFRFAQVVYRHMDRQNVSVCVSNGGKSVRLKNAPLPHGRRTSESRWHPCALGFRRAENNKACSSPSARAILRTHGHLSPLIASHTDALAIRVTTRVRHEPRGYQCFLGVDLKGKKIFDPSAEFLICYSIYSSH